MKPLSSKVRIAKMSFIDGVLSFDEGRFRLIDDSGKQLLDVSTDEIKKVRYRVGLLYLFTVQGREIVSFDSPEIEHASEEERAHFVDESARTWLELFVVQGVNVRSYPARSFRKYLQIAATIIVIIFARDIIVEVWRSLFG